MRDGLLVRRVVVVVIGLGVVVATLVAAAGPYRETRAFFGVFTCPSGPVSCFADEPALVVGRRTYTTTSTDFVPGGGTSTSRTTHHEVTWRRATGLQETREVAPRFYDAVAEGRPATLLVWRGEVVGATGAGAQTWFFPSAVGALWLWLALAYVGLGVAVWGLFVDRRGRDLDFDTWIFTWVIASLVPVTATVALPAFGLGLGSGLGLSAAIAAAFAAVGVRLAKA